MPFAYYDRLTPRRRRTYDRSDRIAELPVPRGRPLAPCVDGIAAGLSAADEAAVGAACRALLDDLAARFGVPPLRVEIHPSRPSGDWGELHGLYHPADAGESARIEVWMRTARHGRIVAFRTFLRTLLHEFCHHIDYELLGLEETFHTEGFYKRESHLLSQLAGPPARRGAAPARETQAGSTETGTRGASAHRSS